MAAGAHPPAPLCPQPPPRGTPLTTAAMRLPGGCPRLAGVLPLLAAGLRRSPGGFLLLHEAPAAWGTRCRHSLCTEGLVRLLTTCHQLLLVMLGVACSANMPGLGSWSAVVILSLSQELIKLWTVHILQRLILGSAHLPWACCGS